MTVYIYKCNLCKDTFFGDDKNLFGVKWDSNDFIICPCDSSTDHLCLICLRNASRIYEKLVFVETILK